MIRFNVPIGDFGVGNGQQGQVAFASTGSGHIYFETILLDVVAYARYADFHVCVVIGIDGACTSGAILVFYFAQSVKQATCTNQIVCAYVFHAQF